MISEDKQLKTWRIWVIGFAIFVIGVLIGAWSDKYFWYVICSVLVIPAGILINIMWRGWK